MLVHQVVFSEFKILNIRRGFVAATWVGSMLRRQFAFGSHRELISTFPQLGGNMDYVSTRQFTRVNFQRNVQLDFGGKKYSQQTVHDLSLSGIYVNGEFDQKTDDTCVIELSKAEYGAGVELRACCSVVRVNDSGIALEFTSMGHDSFLFLQTTLLYEADDPLLLGAEFVKNVRFTVTSDEDEE